MRSIRTVVVGVTVASILALTTPQARADDATFVRSAQELEFVQASDNLILMARSACYYLSRNRTPVEVIARIARYANVDVDKADQFLDLSIAEYCPGQLLVAQSQRVSFG